MKKWLILAVISLIVLGCQAKKVYVGKEGGDAPNATLTEKQYLTLPDEFINGFADKGDFFETEIDPLKTADSLITGLTPIGLAIPGSSLLLGIAGTVVTMLRKYRPIVEEGKEDGQALYELVRGVLKAGNGGGVKTVTGPALAESLRSSMSDHSKEKVKKMLTKINHDSVDIT